MVKTVSINDSHLRGMQNAFTVFISSEDMASLTGHLLLHFRFYKGRLKNSWNLQIEFEPLQLFFKNI